MSEVIIFLLVLISLSASLGIGLFILLLINFKNNRKTNYRYRGTFIYKLDPITRKITKYNVNTNDKIKNLQTNPNSVNQKIILNRITFKNFNYTTILAIITESLEGSKLFREALHEIDNGQTEIEYQFIPKNIEIYNKKRLAISFSVSLAKIHNVSDYLMVVNWILLMPNTLLEKKYLIDVEKVIDHKATYKGFLSFNLNARILYVENKFMQEIIDLKKRIHFDAFSWRGMIFLVCYANKYKKIKRKVNLLIKLIKNKIKKIGLGTLINGAASARFFEVSHRKEFNKVLLTLDFITNLSLRWNKLFVDLKEAQQYKLEFNQYNQQIKIFWELIRTYKFTNKLLPIKNIEEDTKIIEYFCPVFSIDPNSLKNILLNSYNHYQMINANAKKAINKSLDSPILLDVNQSWFLENIEDLNKNKISYILNLDCFEEFNQIEKTIPDLLKKGFSIGFRIEKFSKSLITLITLIKPPFVLIDKKITSSFDWIKSEDYFNLVAFKKSLDLNNIKIIYENLPLENNRLIIEQLGAELYFSN